MDIFGILDPDPYENLCGSLTLYLTKFVLTYLLARLHLEPYLILIQTVLRIQIRMDPVFFTYPDPGFKSPDPDPSIYKLMWSKWWFWWGFVGAWPKRTVLRVLDMKYKLFFYFYPSFKTFFHGSGSGSGLRKKSLIRICEKNRIRNTGFKGDLDGNPGVKKCPTTFCLSKPPMYPGHLKTDCNASLKYFLSEKISDFKASYLRFCSDNDYTRSQNFSRCESFIFTC